MPIKRRTSKSRKQLDELEMEDLWYGPGTCLLAGMGYCGQLASSDWFEKLPPVEQAVVLEAMRADWERHRQTVMAAWHARSEHDLYIAREYHNDPDQPWAATEFGEPQ